MSTERIVSTAVFSEVGRKVGNGNGPEGKFSGRTMSKGTAGVSGTRSSRGLPGRLKLHSFIDLAHCRRCPDKGVYYGNELVGAITRVGKHWNVWRILDFGQPMDRAELAMYEEQMKRMAVFDSLHDACMYVKGPFCDLVLGELQLRGKKEK